jgi:hypothetical protein
MRAAVKWNTFSINLFRMKSEIGYISPVLGKECVKEQW